MKTKFTLLLLFYLAFSYAQVDKKATHTFYAVGDAGTTAGSTEVLKAMADQLQRTQGDATVLFLGNSASPTGFAKDDSLALKNLDEQFAVLKPFHAKVLYLPGYTDWKNGLPAILEQANYINDALGKERSFLPANGCGLKKIEINAGVDLLLVDSQWAIMDWDRYPNLNNDCSVRTKAGFYSEIDHEIVKSEGKIVLIALYHSLLSYGPHGNSFSFGINPQDIANAHYQDFSDKLLTIALRFKNIVFLSGNEQLLQYNAFRSIPMIISGSAGHSDSSGTGPYNKFSASENGFARLTAYSDGSMGLSFYGASNGFALPLYESEILSGPQSSGTGYETETVPEYIYKSIYTPEELEHSGLYKSLWGKHYRKDYLTPVRMKAVLLDTLYGGLKPVRRGGGHQTNSLRLEDSQGREYTMRTAKKSALRFIQYFIFKTQYLGVDLEDTYFIQLLQDYWTTANPYGALTMADLSDAIDIYHSNTQLFYVPKQKALGPYNEDFGDAVYFIEEQAKDGWGSLRSFGYADTIIGTDELIEKLEHRDRISINESLYIRSRLFDNVIGDFDRHHDQWRWTEQKQPDGNFYYSPIPRDRDQAFANFDGFMIGVITTLNPPLRFMQPYMDRYKFLRWYSDAGDDVDRIILRDDTEEDWVREAQFIQQKLSPEIVDKAFENLPEGVDEQNKARVKAALLGRTEKLEQQARDLYRYLKSRVVISGTNKNDRFFITRKADGITNIKIYRATGGEQGLLYWDVDYNKAITKEIRLYGLEGSDVFESSGDGSNPIPIKIIGGQDNDTYDITNCSRIHVYDQKSQPNTFEHPVRKTLSDDYQLNTFNYLNPRRDVSQIMPMLDFNPDDGVGIGAGYSYTVNSLVRNPFTSRHTIKGRFYTATSGLNLDYSGEFANVINDINLGIKAGFTTPYYTRNYFGMGNETPDYDNEGMDYNRIRFRSIYFAPSLIYRGYYGSEIAFTTSYKHLDFEQTPGRYIAIAGVNPQVFDGQDLLTAEASYAYNNFDSNAMPKKGIGASLAFGYTENLTENRGFAYIIPELRVTSKVDRRGILVFATKIKGMHIFNETYEFYQAATIGDGDGLRGYRQQRFSGQSSLYQNTDLRLRMGRLRNGFIPITFGIYGGFDYGRVWQPGEHSKIWHTSQGGGLFFNLAGFTTANVAFFNSRDGNRVSAGLSLAF